MQWFSKPQGGASLVAQLVKNPPAMWETWIWSLGWDDPLEKGKSTHSSMSFPCGSDGKESACNAGDLDSIPGSGRSPGEGNGNPFEYSCLENPVGRGAWQSIVHGVAKTQTRLRNFHFTSLHFNHHLSNKWGEDAWISVCERMKLPYHRQKLTPNRPQT